MAERSRAKRERLYCLRYWERVSPKEIMYSKTQIQRRNIFIRRQRHRTPGTVSVGQAVLMGRGGTGSGGCLWLVPSCGNAGAHLCTVFQGTHGAGPARTAQPDALCHATPSPHGQHLPGQCAGDSTSTGLHIDHKRLQALQEKRIALGHRPDDHVEQTMGGMTMR